MHQNLLSQEEQQTSIAAVQRQKAPYAPRAEGGSFSCTHERYHQIPATNQPDRGCQILQPGNPFVESTETYSVGEPLLESVHTALCRLSSGWAPSHLWDQPCGAPYGAKPTHLFLAVFLYLRTRDWGAQTLRKKFFLSTTGPERLCFFQQTAFEVCSSQVDR